MPSKIIDNDLAIKTIIAEAANQPYEIMIGIGEAIRNRGSLKPFQGSMRKDLDVFVGKQPLWVRLAATKAWQDSEESNTIKGADHVFYAGTDDASDPWWANPESSKVKDKKYVKKRVAEFSGWRFYK